MKPTLSFDLNDAQNAYEKYGANCGPGALAAVAQVPLKDAVMAIPDFVKKGHTKETMMRSALRVLQVNCVEKEQGPWPSHGLVRVLWHGPWWDDGLIARFMRSHWVGTTVLDGKRWTFDINAMSVGGWLLHDEWVHDCAPYVASFEKDAYGTWSSWETWSVELSRIEQG